MVLFLRPKSVYFFVVQAFCYIGRTDNPLFSRSFFCFPPIVLLTRLDVVGSEPLDVLADRIWRSIGPSGRNKVRAWSDLYFCPSRPFCGGLCIRPSRSSPETRTRIS